jgi:hypothetical protein
MPGTIAGSTTIWRNRIIETSIAAKLPSPLERFAASAVTDFS